MASQNEETAFFFDNESEFDHVMKLMQNKV
jgi:hypothetical protein